MDTIFAQIRIRSACAKPHGIELCHSLNVARIPRQPVQLPGGLAAYLWQAPVISVRFQYEVQKKTKVMTDVAIIGAGPYGLSVAAHLQARGVDFRIFRPPMHTWLNHMPKGMRLKSEGFASSLYDPQSQLTLGKFCEEKRYPLSRSGSAGALRDVLFLRTRVSTEIVPNVENKLVTSLDREP